MRNQLSLFLPLKKLYPATLSRQIKKKNFYFEQLFLQY